MIGKEALVLLTNSSRLMAEKMEEPILHVHIWINSRIAIAVTRFYSRIIGVDCLPVPCETGSWPGNQVWVWDWRNILCAEIVLRTPA